MMIMLIDMGLSPRHTRVTGRKLFAEPFHGTSEVEHAEQNQHQAHGEFHSQAGAGRDDDAEENDGAADNGDRQGMATAPKNADQAGFQDGTLPADDCRNGNDMVGIGGVAHPEKKTDYKNGESASQESIFRE